MASGQDNHAAEMRSSLMHRRANRLHEKEQLSKAAARIKEIDDELALIDADLKRYSPEPAEPAEGNLNSV